MTSLDLVFAGSSDFAVESLEALAGSPHRLRGVYTQPPRPAGRRRRPAPTPVQERAEALGVEVHRPETLRDPAARAPLEALAPDAMVVVDYGLILPPEVLSIPRLGCINGHASLLPRWRGAAPVERAVLAGDEQTGITVMRMDEGLDTGDVLLVRSLAIRPGEAAGELRKRLAGLCAEALLEALDGLAEGSLPARPQPPEGATYAAKIRPEEAELDWREPAVVLARSVRAFDPRPGAWTRYGDARLKVLAAEPIDESRRPPGKVFRAEKGGIDVAAGEGALRIHRLQLPGGKPLSAAQFVNGHDILGHVLGPADAGGRR